MTFESAKTAVLSMLEWSLIVFSVLKSFNANVSEYCCVGQYERNPHE